MDDKQSLYRHLKHFETIFASVGGVITVDQQETGAKASILPPATFVIGPLNPPLPEQLEFRGSEALAFVRGERQAVEEEMIQSGLHMFLLLDPRTYLKTIDILSIEGEETTGGMSAYVSYPVAELFKELNIPKEEAQWLASVFGSKYASSFSFSGESVGIAIQDPIPEMGTVTVRYPIPR